MKMVRKIIMLFVLMFAIQFSFAAEYCSKEENAGEIYDDKKYYCVKSGDTLSKIFDAHISLTEAKSYQELAELNSISNAHKIFIKQKIYFKKPPLTQRVRGSLFSEDGEKFYVVKPGDSLTRIYNHVVVKTNGDTVSFPQFVQWNIDAGKVNKNNLDLIEIDDEIIVQKEGVSAIAHLEGIVLPPKKPTLEGGVVLDEVAKQAARLGVTPEDYKDFADYLVSLGVKVRFEELSEKDFSRIFSQFSVAWNLDNKNERFLIVVYDEKENEAKTYISKEYSPALYDFYIESRDKKFKVTDLDKAKFKLQLELEDAKRLLVLLESLDEDPEKIIKQKEIISKLEEKLENFDENYASSVSEIFSQLEKDLTSYSNWYSSIIINEDIKDCIELDKDFISSYEIIGHLFNVENTSKITNELVTEIREKIEKLDVTQRVLVENKCAILEEKDFSGSCYDSKNVGTIGKEGVCKNMLIVDNEMLKSASSKENGGDGTFKFLYEIDDFDVREYTFGDSEYNIFTGQVTDMNSLFLKSDFNSNINYWDVGNVENMGRLFDEAIYFDQPLDNWDVGKVTNMGGMFSVASSFDQSLDNWDTSSVEVMSFIFYKASSFNQPLNSWNVENVEIMHATFKYATSFNQPLNNWDVSKASNMQEMFEGAEVFDQNLSSWCTSITSPFEHFKEEFKPNCDEELSSPSIDPASADCYDSTNVGKIGTSGKCKNMLIVDDTLIKAVASKDVGGDESFTFAYDGVPYTFENSDKNIFTGQVTDMGKLLSGTNFNGDISYWDTSNVDSMAAMFVDATSFNQPLDNWEVKNVRFMGSMFRGASSFNQPLNSWDVSKVTVMDAMFVEATSFNQPLNNWDVDQVTIMGAIFDEASSFNQDLSSWCVEDLEPFRDFKEEFKPNCDEELSSPSTDPASADCYDSANVGKIGISGKCKDMLIVDNDMLREGAKARRFDGDGKVYNYVVIHGNTLYSFENSERNIFTGQVTNMAGLFFKLDFNGDINYWDVSNVESMNSMFYEADSFNQPLNDWDTSNVKDMQYMFFNADSFNQPLNKWNVDIVQNGYFLGIFEGASSFDQDLSSWCIYFENLDHVEFEHFKEEYRPGKCS